MIKTTQINKEGYSGSGSSQTTYYNGQAIKLNHFLIGLYRKCRKDSNDIPISKQIVYSARSIFEERDKTPDDKIPAKELTDIVTDAARKNINHMGLPLYMRELLQHTMSYGGTAFDVDNILDPQLRIMTRANGHAYLVNTGGDSGTENESEKQAA